MLIVMNILFSNLDAVWYLFSKMRTIEMLKLLSLSKFHLSLAKKFDDEFSWSYFLTRDFSDDSGKLKDVVPSSIHTEYSSKDRYKKAFSLSIFNEFLIKIQCLPHTFESSLENKLFYIMERDLEFLSKKIDCFPNLKQISIYNNLLTCLPTEFANLTRLTVLKLDYNYIRNFPKEITNLINLKSLSMTYNDLDSIPKGIGNLIKLNYLNLNHNSIKTIPKEISKLTNLRKLHLEDNFITVKNIPKEAKQLTLHTLCITKNRSHLDLLLGAFGM